MSDNPDPDRVRRYRAAFAKLPRIQREIFLAHRIDGLDYPEIARRTGLSVRQVERHLAQALWKIDKQLEGRRLGWWERRF